MQTIQGGLLFLCLTFTHGIFSTLNQCQNFQQELPLASAISAISFSSYVAFGPDQGSTKWFRLQNWIP